MPLTARPAPARKEIHTLGTLIFQKISDSMLPDAGCKMALNDIVFIPTIGAHKKTIMVRTRRRAIGINLLCLEPVFIMALPVR
jgi:hypothetical protein